MTGMSPAVLVERVSEAGFRIDLTDNGPQLVRVSNGARLPPDLLAALKAHRAALVVFLRSGREPESDPEGETCQATVFVRSPEVQRMCCMKQCPYRRRAG